MSKRSFRIIASVIAATLAVGAAAIVRAYTDGRGSAGAGSSAVGASAAGSSSSNDASGLARLLSVTPDGNGATYGTYTAAGSVASSSSSWLTKSYPKQAAATQTSTDPASSYWALLIGINDYSGNTPSNIGSKQDAQSLSSYLQKLGWRSDHILLLTDLSATASHIIIAIRWLASKTDGSSTVVFHYAGHEDWRRSSSEDTGRDVGIWAADNRMIYEKTLGQELGRVRAAHMWIDMATCRAAGFDEPGMVKSGRVLTYSSTKAEYSYEQPSWHHSVFGYYMIVQGMSARRGDANRDGKVTVEEAFAYAKNPTASYTSYQQHPVIVDKAGGKMSLTVPKPKPAPTPSPSSTQPATVPKTCVVVCF